MKCHPERSEGSLYLALFNPVGKILSGPVVFLAFDSPRRDPKDIIFTSPH
jgi:hypothetical protein